MNEITTTAPAVPAAWDDVQRALTGGGDGKSCQCMWPILSNTQWRETSADQRREMLHHEIEQGPPPGLVAHVDGEAAGWVRVGPRINQDRLGRSRIVTQGSAEPLDDESVWAISCFSIRREHRRKGLTTTLLEAAIAHARDNGARMLEAYPIDRERTKATSNMLFVGSLTTFVDAGFDVVARPTASRVVVSLGL
jgi:GNAT superfamily N-acetyltransferase